MKEAYKDQVLGTSTIFQLHKEFSEGWESPTLIPYDGQPEVLKQISILSLLLSERTGTSLYEHSQNHCTF